MTEPAKLQIQAAAAHCAARDPTAIQRAPLTRGIKDLIRAVTLVTAEGIPHISIPLAFGYSEEFARSLLRRQAAPIRPGQHPSVNILHYAAQSGDTPLVRLLMGAPYNHQPVSEELNQAAAHGDEQLVVDLLETIHNLRPAHRLVQMAVRDWLPSMRKQWPALADSPYWALCHAAAQNQGDLLQRILREYCVQPDHTILSRVIKNGNIELFQSLVRDYGLRPNEDDLHTAILEGHLDLVQLLLAPPYNLQPRNHSTNFACGSGNFDLFLLLTQPPYNIPLQGQVEFSLGAVVAKGKIPFAQHLMAPPYNLQPTPNILLPAVRSKNIQMLRLFMNPPYNFQPDQRTFDEAATFGTMEMVQLFMAPPYNLRPTQHTFNQVVRTGNDERIRVFMAPPHNLRPDQETMVAVFIAHHLPLFHLLTQPPYNFPLPQPHQFDMLDPPLPYPPLFQDTVVDHQRRQI